MSEVIATSTTISHDEKDSFSGKLMYLLTAIGCAVGFGNVWRFPYLVYTYGGLAFILVYLIVLVLITYPTMILEMGMGQVLREGQIKAWTFMGKRCRSAGLGGWVSFTICFFYPLLLAWCLIFFVNSFDGTFKWENPSEWASECTSFTTSTLCSSKAYCQWQKSTCNVDSLYNSNRFLRDTVYVHDDFGGADRNIQITGISAAPVLGFLVSWILCFICTCWGARIMGYSQYVTMTLPTIFIIVLLVISASQVGAGEGIRDYTAKFNMSKFSTSMWIDAICQSIFSASLGQGAVTVLAAHNKPNDNMVLNGAIVLVADTVFAYVAGFAVFSMIGFLSHQSQTPISDLKLSGISLAFSTYPAALARFPNGLAQAAAALFFLTLWLIGFSTLVTLGEAVINFAKNSRIGIRYKFKTWVVSLVLSLFFFLVPGLLLSTNAGLALFDSLDNYSALFQGFAAGLQTICAGWLYLANYSLNKVGKLAFIVHCSTFFLGAIFLGILDNVNAAAAVVLGLGIPVLGLIAAVYLCRKSDDHGNLYTIKDTLYYLGPYNVDPLRKSFNDIACANSKFRIPVIWTYLIKYLVPFVTVYLTASGLTDPSKMYSRPDRAYPYPWYVFFLSQLSPFLMFITMIIALVLPNSLDFFFPRGKKESVFGEQYIELFDRYRSLDADSSPATEYLNTKKDVA